MKNILTYIEIKDAAPIKLSLESLSKTSELAKEKGVEMPICNVVYAILYENRDAEEAIGSLFDRSLKEEFY